MGGAPIRHAQLAVLAMGHSDVPGLARCLCGMTRRLRVGILVDTTVLYAWQHVLLERIRNADYAQIAVIIVHNHGTHVPEIEPRALRPTLLHRVAARVAERIYL